MWLIFRSSSRLPRCRVFGKSEATLAQLYGNVRNHPLCQTLLLVKFARQIIPLLGGVG